MMISLKVKRTLIRNEMRPNAYKWLFYGISKILKHN